MLKKYYQLHIEKCEKSLNLFVIIVVYDWISEGVVVLMRFLASTSIFKNSN